MVIMYILGTAWLLYLLYRFYFKPIKTYDNVIYRSSFYRMIGLKKKEKQLYLWAMEEMELSSSEERDLMYVLGLWYSYEHNCSEAVKYFDQAFQGYDKNFSYKKEFHYVIDSYIECEKREKAKEILNFFLERKKFDRKFIKLEKRYSNLL